AFLRCSPRLAPTTALPPSSAVFPFEELPRSDVTAPFRGSFWCLLPLVPGRFSAFVSASLQKIQNRSSNRSHSSFDEQSTDRNPIFNWSRSSIPMRFATCSASTLSLIPVESPSARTKRQNP